MQRSRNSQARSHSLVGAIARDVHFWIPVIVLVAGLAVLRWIS